MKNYESKFQIGKAGITKGVLESLDLDLKTHKQVRISTLKTAGRDKEKIKEMALKIIEGLKTKSKAKIIGFTIIVRRIGLLNT